jgi:MATE family multidrug resistance protein
MADGLELAVPTTPLTHLRDALARELRPTLRLALPLVIAELSWMTMGIVDTLMVGRLPSSAIAIAAVSLGSSLYHVLLFFGGGLLLGMDTLVAHAFGREDLEEARRILACGVFLALVLTPPLMLAISFWPPVVAAVGVTPDVLGPMRPFLVALNWSTLPLLLYFACRRYLQAVHVVKPVTFAMISANLLNAVGNWIFIYGHWGAPQLGIVGSGISTLFARIYMALVMVATVLWFQRRHPAVSPFAVDFGRLRRLLALGLPAASQFLLEVGVFSAVTALCGKLGAVALAGHQIALNCAAFTYMVPLGFASAAAVRVGNNLGRGDRRAAGEAGWTAIFLGAAFMTSAGIVMLAIPRLIARAFSPDPAVVHAASVLLMIAAAFQLFDGLQTVATGALRGAGDTRTPMIANFIAYWIIGLPLGMWLCFRVGWGAPGLWAGLCLGLILIGTTLLWVWRTKMRSPPRSAGAAHESA